MKMIVLQLVLLLLSVLLPAAWLWWDGWDLASGLIMGVLAAPFMGIGLAYVGAVVAFAFDLDDD